jgi:archaellum biogenesis protein FlaJ (TadC family)
MLCVAAYAAAATAIALGVAVALINVILVLSVLGGKPAAPSQQHHDSFEIRRYSQMSTHSMARSWLAAVQIPVLRQVRLLISFTPHGAGVTLAIVLGCTGVALFFGACVAGSTAFTVAVGEQQCLTPTVASA